MEITFSPAFIKAFNKKSKFNSLLVRNFRDTIDIFKQNPFDMRLKTHKLSGELKDFYSFSLEYDCRIIFYFTDNNKVVFFDVGSHDEVY
ncbi:MAG: type II toxin-antitoxin system YafQ family toxin [Candidatus Kapabacteria bacterium]|nr:type II toxin-antitoxin system YafQ family toxin [Candidatus Kapabacteria bacterium]